MRLLKDQRGVAIALLTVVFAVVMVALMFICFNEIILHVGSYAETFESSHYGSTLTILLTLWRATPVVLLFAIVGWAILRAHKHSMGGY